MKESGESPTRHKGFHGDAHYFPVNDCVNSCRSGRSSPQAVLNALMLQTNRLSENLVGFSLQFLGGCFTTRMRLHVWIEAIEFFYAELARGFSFYGGAELLKMHTDTVQREAGFAIRTHDSTH